MISDRSGFRYPASEIVRQWDGLLVAKREEEPRHPQEFVRGVVDDYAVRNPRPPAPYEATVSTGNTHHHTDGCILVGEQRGYDTRVGTSDASLVLFRYNSVEKIRLDGSKVQTYDPVNTTGHYEVDGVQVVTNRVVDANLADTAALTAQTLTDNSGGVASDTIAAIGAVYSQSEVANAIASLADEINKLRADNAAQKVALDAALSLIRTHGLGATS